MDKASKNPIECSVENCHYNKSHMCQAESIKVDAMGDREAQTSDGTSCSTFKKHEPQG